MSGSSGPVPARRGLREVAVRSALLALLVIAYRLAFAPLHGVVGQPAFLFGLVPCLAAAVLLGWRGAVAMIAVVALIDRGSALTLAAGPDTGRAAGVIALLAKLLVAGGLGLIVDSRRRVGALNAQLRHEIEARRRSDESLRHSAELHRALVESLGEGVGLFDGEGRVVFANEALASTLKVSRDELLGARDLTKSRSPATHRRCCSSRKRTSSRTAGETP
jgi:PAS domain-containing protein